MLSLRDGVVDFHSQRFNKEKERPGIWYLNTNRSIIFSLSRGVAQPGSAHAWGAWGQRFESSRPEVNNLVKSFF